MPRGFILEEERALETRGRKGQAGHSGYNRADGYRGDRIVIMGILTGGCRHRPDNVHQVDVGGFEVYDITNFDIRNYFFECFFVCEEQSWAGYEADKVRRRIFEVRRLSDRFSKLEIYEDFTCTLNVFSNIENVHFQILNIKRTMHKSYARITRSRKWYKFGKNVLLWS